MNDAISRSAAMKTVDALRNDDLYPVELDWIARDINVLPSLDVAPVVHARWNEEDGTCSACYHEACYDEWTEPKWDYDWDENLVQTGEETHIQFIFSPYCPNCGARMDGDADAV